MIAGSSTTRLEPYRTDAVTSHDITSTIERTRGSVFQVVVLYLGVYSPVYVEGYSTVALCHTHANKHRRDTPMRHVVAHSVATIK